MSRAMWSGLISFGLVNVPVRLHSVIKDKDIHFHLMSRDGKCRLRRKLVCPETGEEFDFKDTAKGYEIAPDQYVIINEQELAQLKPEAGRVIAIKHFVDLAEIDPVYYNRPYYLFPDENGANAYQLLLQAMLRSKRVAIASFVMRGKEYLAAIRPMDEALCLETMNFADEVTPVSDLAAPVKGEVDKKQLDVAVKLIEALETKFEPANYREEYRERVADLIERKAGGEKTEKLAATTVAYPRNVSDLMKALEASVTAARRAGSASGGRNGHGNGSKAAGRKRGRADDGRASRRRDDREPRRERAASRRRGQ